jgi:hypothetical protein
MKRDAGRAGGWVCGAWAIAGLLLAGAPARAQDAYTGAVAHWTLDETSGALAHDVVGGRNGDLVNMEQSDWTAGKVHGALSFDGVNEFVNGGDWEFVSTGFTFTAWVYPADPVPGDQNILSKYLGNERSYVIRIGGNDMFIGVSKDGQGGASLTELSTTSNKLGPGWNFIAATYDGTTIRLYVNGSTPEASAAHSGGVYTNGTAFFLLAKQGTSCFNGRLDEVAIWNRALSNAEIFAVKDAYPRAGSVVAVK